MIRFEQVTKRFGSKVVLDSINLEVRQGETFVIVGSSGAGKSVTLRHMIRLLTPDSGRVLVKGHCINEARGRELTDLLGYFGVLFQSSALMQWLNVEDNVCLPLRQKTNRSEEDIRQRVAEVLGMVGLEGVQERAVSEISGGMQKRVGLARAIVMNPEIVLYDEPTSGLDPIISRQIDMLMDDLRKRLGVTSVVVSHDLYSALGIGSRVAMLHKGQVIACGTPEEFVTSPHPVVQQFIHAQGIRSLQDVRKAFEK